MVAPSRQSEQPIHFLTLESFSIRENLPSEQSAIDRLKQTYRRAIELRFQQGFPDLFNAKLSVKDVLIKNATDVTSSDRMWEALERLFDDAKREGCITTEIPTEVLVYSAIARVRDSELDHSWIRAGSVEKFYPNF